MKNLFSSPIADLQKLFHILDLVLTEQRHQRLDMATIKNQLHTLIKDIALQKQVDDYYGSDNGDKDSNKNRSDLIQDPTEI